jgi:ATP-binding cassette subfamily B protein
MIPTWPISRLGEALEVFGVSAGKSRVRRAGKVPRPPQNLAEHDHLLSHWIDAVAAWLGLESERIYATYGEIEDRLRTAGPAFFRLHDRTFIVLLDSRHVLAPDFSVRLVKPKALVALLTRHLEVPLVDEVDHFLMEVGVPRWKRPKARAAIMRERLNEAVIGPCWVLRTPPGGSFWRAAKEAGLLWRMALLTGAHFVEYGFWIVSWWLVGAGALGGRFDAGWFAAWVLLLLTLIPLRAATTWLEGVVSVTGGGLLKERLLSGALNLEPDEVRCQGAGQLLGRVVESEALESLALGGGFLAALAVIELAVAAAVLAVGAGGTLNAALLLLWIALALALSWRYFRKSRAWTEGRLSMTHELVERMVGHRTRLAQEDREGWHEEEDQALDRYLTSSSEVDRAAVWLNALVPAAG